MKHKYVISGDGTGRTYGIYKVLSGVFVFPIDRDLVEGGLKNLTAARKRVKELNKQDGESLDD